MTRLAILVCIALGLSACDKAKPEMATSTDGLFLLQNVSHAQAGQVSEDLQTPPPPPAPPPKKTKYASPTDPTQPKQPKQ